MSQTAHNGLDLVHQFSDLLAHQNGDTTTIVRGEGVHVYDTKGNRYIDAMSGSSCASLGFSDARLVRAMTEQAQQLPYYHLFAQKSHEPAEDLARRLVSMSPAHLRHVLFANSGSEANDAAIRILRAVNIAQGKPDKRLVIARLSGYHGSTTLSASITGQQHMRFGSDGVSSDVRFIPEVCHYRHALDGESEEDYAARCAADLEAAILEEGAKNVAAFIAEPVMASAGCLIPPKGYFEKVEAVLRRHDVALIADEVVCAFGRLDAPFGSTKYGLSPDIMTLAKPLTGGYFPLSALLLTDEIYDTLTVESTKTGLLGHGLTYAGHPIGCAVAAEALEIYSGEDFRMGLRETITRFEQHLAEIEQHPMVGETRNSGLLGAIDIVEDKATRKRFDINEKVTFRLGRELQRNGVITRWTSEAVNLCPPLIIGETELDLVFDRLNSSLDQIYSELSPSAGSPS
ncbi:aminotransferase class III-fold pyridoxal phosphate-dependent enzyme [Roseovarius atlanticus]|uniref:aminotransferase class III-fold pyridoxal phosphate-dependent enzyme n=1 Tax=Roseovarius atlanticus TaxID=1641875 RepID=UPI001C953AC1|nr:aminotransferase class III-fold pyridoxal phosphate-dependent enzyme [Roseovarius atlanticus]MBY5989142.1 aminotransferase class III-fold pyridoxal phosphate-dependent enzyme [Roseovarius atlanticus]MBY6124534.1 aminotransferase class III-fold pyridoxal phosphate-dependent enzyme [Roseovarius atlanticus]MBY6149029.1 aminotransferase class III-fold pyridoxal phosphate-dependent enzyme [Roseovarius atlanticus]